MRSLTPNFRKKRFSCFWGQITHIRTKSILSMLAPHFRGRVDLPKKSATWNPASINETEPRPFFFELDLTGSQATFSTAGALREGGSMPLRPRFFAKNAFRLRSAQFLIKPAFDGDDELH